MAKITIEFTDIDGSLEMAEEITELLDKFLPYMVDNIKYTVEG